MAWRSRIESACSKLEDLERVSPGTRVALQALDQDIAIE